MAPERERTLVDRARSDGAAFGEGRELRADPRFSRSEILRAPRVGNPVVVSPGELAVLDEWLG